MLSLITSTLMAGALCILNGGTVDRVDQYVFGPQMTTIEYRAQKDSMGYGDMADHDFLKFLKGYCPEQLGGIDAIGLSELNPTLSYQVAWEEAQGEQYTVYADRPESGLGILFHDNGWRLDTDGNWRDSNGRYPPTSIHHDARQYEGTCGLAPFCAGFSSAQDVRNGAGATATYIRKATEPAAQPAPVAVVDGAGPVEAPANEFLDEPHDATGVTAWLKWAAQFCGTIVILLILLGVVFGGIFAVGSFTKDREAQGSGTYASRIKSALGSKPVDGEGMVS